MSRAYPFRASLRCMLLAAALSWVSGPSGAADAAPSGDKYALLVGVRTYIPTELKKLQYTENDVTDLAAALTAGGYPADNVRLLTQAAAENNPDLLPTGKNISAELDRLVRICKPGDGVLVAFAGHGVQFKNGDESYFCPMDAKLSDKSTLIPFSEVCGRLEKCKASTKLLLVDACRNDPQADNSRSVDKVELESVTRPQEKVRPGGTAVFFSCSATEKVFEDPDLKHGVFFHFVIEGLRGEADLDQDGTVVLPELEIYTKKQVQRFVADKLKSDQHPDLVVKSNSGLVPLVTVSRERASLSSFVESANAVPVGGYVHLIAHAVSADGKTVVLEAQGGKNDTEGFVSVWDVPSKKEIAKLPFAVGGPPVALSADGKRVAHNFYPGPVSSSDYQNILKVYDLAAGKETVSIKNNAGGWSLAFTADDSLLLQVMKERGTWDLHRLDSATGASVPVFPKGENTVSDVLAISANGEALARVGGGKKLEIWDVAKGKMLSRSSWSAGGTAIQNVAFSLSPDGKYLLEKQQDGLSKAQFSVWDAASGQATSAIPIPPFSFDKTAFCSDGTTVVVKYDDEGLPGQDTSRLKFFDLATGKERPNSTPLARVFDFALSRDGAKMVTVHQVSNRDWVVKVGDLPMSVRKKP